jgi:hypothetical protein
VSTLTDRCAALLRLLLRLLLLRLRRLRLQVDGNRTA